jgi:hypothetical protein
MSKIELIERSVRCFTLGLFSFLPVIGVVTALLCLDQRQRVKRAQGDTWNPAQHYLFWAAVSSWVGILLLIPEALAVFLIALSAAPGP